MVSLFALSIVSHNTVYSTSAQELRLHGLIPTCIFIELEHQQDCQGRYCCLFGNAGVLFMSDISPLSTSSSLSPSLSQFLQLSQLTGAIFQLSPSGEHTERLNNFSIYMHGVIRYHSRTVRHFHTGKNTQRTHGATQTLRGSFQAFVCNSL